jgi:hypothetical protein
VKQHYPHGGDDAKSREGLYLSAAHNTLSVRPLVVIATAASSVLLRHLSGRLTPRDPTKPRRWEGISAIGRMASWRAGVASEKSAFGRPAGTAHFAARRGVIS